MATSSPVSEQTVVPAARKAEFPPLDEVRRNLRVKWYRSPIDPTTLRRLMRRSDLQGALQALGHLGLFAATGMWLKAGKRRTTQRSFSTFARAFTGMTSPR